MHNLKQIITNFLIVYLWLDILRMYYRRFYGAYLQRKFLKELDEKIKQAQQEPDYDAALRMITCNDKDCDCNK